MKGMLLASNPAHADQRSHALSSNQVELITWVILHVRNKSEYSCEGSSASGDCLFKKHVPNSSCCSGKTPPCQSTNKCRELFKPKSVVLPLTPPPATRTKPDSTLIWLAVTYSYSVAHRLTTTNVTFLANVLVRLLRQVWLSAVHDRIGLSKTNVMAPRTMSHRHYAASPLCL